MANKPTPAPNHPDFGDHKPTDPADLAALLPKLQGNILKGHGRDHTVHIFFRWDAPALPRVRTFIRGLVPPVAAVAAAPVAAAPAVAPAGAGPFGPGPAAPPAPVSTVVPPVLITSAAQQDEETRIYNRFKIPGALFANLFFSAEGYRRLGFSDQQLVSFFPENAAGQGTTSFFKDGMRQHAGELADPPVADWDEGYRGEIHAMLLMADDDRDKLLREARTIITQLERIPGVDVVQVEIGDALRNEDDQAIEHFGYVDGRSQPLFLTTDFTLDDQGHVIERHAVRGGGRIDKWNPAAPLDLVLTDDLAAGEADCKGSYFVFRKFEQDVLRFKMREQELADAMKLKREDRERAGAMAVGRFEDGTPVAVSRTDGFSPAQENNFNYSEDAAALKCPFHAHIRKTNPRGDTVRQFNLPNDSDERSRRITRRGITYGERTKQPGQLPTLSDLPSEGVGLLFMCFQASIAHQFGFMQQSWANNANFVKEATGVDPVIANVAAGATPAPQSWVNEWGDTNNPPTRTEFSFAQFVKLKGGEFFFAPSLPFLRKLLVPVAPPNPNPGPNPAPNPGWNAKPA